MNVVRTLFRLYRPTALAVGLALILIEAAAIIAIRALGPASISPWLLIGGSATRYALLAAGIMLVVNQLRQFVTNGVTRREFLLAAAVLGLTLSVAVAILIPLGHGLEQAVLTAAGRRTGDYPAVAGGREFGRSLAGSMAYFVSGGLFGAIFYRYSPWTGIALLIPAAVPLVASQTLLGYDGTTATGLLPYQPALLITFVAVAAGVLWLSRTMRDVAIRRTAA
jgi:hypothetical protein